MVRPADEALFSATLSDVKIVCDMLKALAFKNRAVVYIDKTGVKVSVEDGRTLQALVWLEKSTWTSYQWRGSEKGDDDSSSSSDASDHEAQEANGGPARAKVRSATFEISLQVLIECLNVFSESASGSGMKGGGRASTSGLDEEAGMTSTRGPKTSAVFSYAGEGEPFVIILEAQRVVTRCELTTYDVDERLALEFDTDEALAHLIMKRKSDWFRDLFQELGTAQTSITFTFAPLGSGASANLSLEADGMFGTTKTDYPNDSDVLETCDIAEPSTNRYAFSMLHHARAAVFVSSKISLRVDRTGLLNLQMLVPTTRDKSVDKAGFIEFRILPRISDTDE